MGDFAALKDYLPSLRVTSSSEVSDYQFTKYKAMVEIESDRVEEAQLLINEARSQIEPVVTSLWNESYSRMYFDRRWSSSY